MSVHEIDFADRDRDDDGQSTSFSKEVEVTLGNDIEVTVTVHLDCIAPSEAPSGLYGPPEFYDPGGAAEFELDYAEVSVMNASNGIDQVRLTPDLFWALLGDKAQLAYDSAVESAQDSGEF